MGRMEDEFRVKRDAGRKLLVPYITGGYPGWQDAIRACAANGADAVEIGIPFSDPVMDGPVIQQASQAALDAGITPAAILDEVPDLDVDIPLAVMTYYNLVHHPGPERFAADLERAGISGAILPDLPLEESAPWCAPADAHGIETIMLAAPTAPHAPLPLVAVDHLAINSAHYAGQIGFIIQQRFRIRQGAREQHPAHNQQHQRNQRNPCAQTKQPALAPFIAEPGGEPAGLAADAHGNGLVLVIV